MGRLKNANLNNGSIRSKLLLYIMTNTENMSQIDSYDYGDELLSELQKEIREIDNENKGELSEQLDDALDALENLESSIKSIKYVIEQQINKLNEL